MTVFYFTATGNSLDVVNALPDAKKMSIPQVLRGRERYFCDDAIGVVFPVYFSDVPNVVKRFLEDVRLDAEYMFAILTYGEVKGMAVNRLQRVARSVGIEFDYINSVKMVDNYYPLYDVARQIDNLPKKRVKEKLDIIRTDVATRLKRAGNVDIFDRLAGVTVLFKPDYTKHSRRFYIEERKCTRCGICETVCPSGDLVCDNGIPRFRSEVCEACGACTHNCPQNAIRYRGERSPNRYRNSKITLKDIIKANGYTKDINEKE